VLCLFMILMKIVPGIPGHFSGYEWLALGVWILLGIALHWRAKTARSLAHIAT